MSVGRIDASDVLDAFPEPALIGTPQGIVEYANVVAVTLAGRELVGADLCELAGTRSEEVRRFLSRCSGSSGPLVGTISLPGRQGDSLQRCYGSALPSSGGRHVLLRCMSAADDRFALLTKRFNDLDAEIRRHRHTHAVLEEALRERDLLVREIHHRVKNNIQILLGMLSASEREAEHPEARRILADANRRLVAMGSVQQVLYASDRLTAHPADEFLKVLIPQLQSTWPSHVRIELAADPIELPADVSGPLGLIINELATNAVKHGIVGQPDPVITIELRAIHNGSELSVMDRGPGFELGGTGKRSSGLGLVRGLARQLGGTFFVERGDGARCVVRFPSWQQHGADLASGRPAPDGR